MDSRKNTRTGLAISSIAAIASLALAGCSGDSPDSGSGGGAEETMPEEVVSIPVGEAFREPVWSVQVEAEPIQPLVTGDHVVAIVHGEVRAWDAKGTEAWQVPIPDKGEDSEPVLRQVSSEVVAVVTTGESEGQGLSESGYAAGVTLINLASGETEDVEITDEANTPALADSGLAFMLSDGTGVVVSSSGKKQKIPGIATTSGPPNDADLDVPLVVVGETPIWATATGTEAGIGYTTGSWSTGDLDLLEHAFSSTIEGVDQGLGLVIVGSHAREHAYAVVDAASGKILSKIDCSPSPFGTASDSPNNEYGAVGSLLLSKSEARCVGGDEGEQNVRFTAIADDGTAYGLASEGELVVARADGDEPSTSKLPKGATPPIGILDGNLAVHLDEDNGIVTANPIS